MSLTTLGLLKAARESLDAHYATGRLYTADGRGCALGWLGYHGNDHIHDDFARMSSSRLWNSEPVRLLAQKIVDQDLGVCSPDRQNAYIVATCNNASKENILKAFDLVIADLEVAERSDVRTVLAETIPPADPDDEDDDDKKEGDEKEEATARELVLV